MFSTTTKTAIKAVIFISSRCSECQKVSVKEIAEKIDASEHTVGKALQKLVKFGIVNSVKGPSGGFSISNSQRETPIFDIVAAIEGKEVFDECGLGLSKCSPDHPCPIHDEYKEVKERVKQIFKHKKIKDLCDPVTHGITYLVG
ncbi:MAG: Rrf2 family transcriptional regulator [Flavobacteriia bacterium]|nr:Rrf2 family transcriptional regulator [Flavobacteriia bacterium]